MKVLFVCTENVARSRAAETLFRELQGGVGRHEVRSVGTASHAARRITTRDLAWADVIAVMESRHLDAIRRHWPHHVEKVMVLEILDFFLPDEVELREALQSKVRELLERCDGMAERRSA
jgi:predicted protein tyrosine phosphatase